MKAKGLRPWKKVGKGVLLPMIKSKMRMSIILNLVMTATHLVQPLLLKGMLFYCSAAYYCTEEQAATMQRNHAPKLAPATASLQGTLRALCSAPARTATTGPKSAGTLH